MVIPTKLVGPCRNLESNELRGELPSFKPLSLENLETLSLSNNSLQGEVTSLVRAMDITITNLDLSYNFFSGSIPAEIANLTGLQNLDLSHNNFSGNLNFTLEQLSKLRSLKLNDNALNGSVPDNLWSTLIPDLQVVNLERNTFTELNLTSWYQSVKKARRFNGQGHCNVLLKYNQIERIHPENLEIDIPTPETEEEKQLQRLDSFILLAGNPWCTNQKVKNSNKLLVRYLCREREWEDFWHPSDNHAISTKILIPIIVICGIIGIFIVCGLTFVLLKIRRRARELHQIREALTKEHVKPRFFDYEELKAATNNFSRSKILGKGGFGTVYKADLADGSILAVKRLNPTEQNISDFMKEMVNISGIKHRHLIQLKGCCVRDRQQRMLVYEYAENKSLSEALWEVQPKMVHRDIKPQNILLDKDYNAKIADFGLVRASQVDYTQVTYTIGGTRGYSPPEYVSEGLVSEKLDVYSLGVVLLEIVSGRVCIDYRLPEERIYLRNWSMTLYGEGKLLNLVDEELNGQYDEDEVLLVLQTAVACCQLDSKKRPTMSQVVNSLLKHSDMVVDIVNKLSRQSRLEDIREEVDEDTFASEIELQPFALNSSYSGSTLHVSSLEPQNIGMQLR
ncbi:hypothetical protein R1flu_020386 [Riccia fluitans]|uniref:Protein kinase domain-containing protein n=1 Tax=Riccia fluitans TaxID=41844 RepID=A0ABD1ZLE5_9MARC